MRIYQYNFTPKAFINHQLVMLDDRKSNTQHQKFKIGRKYRTNRTECDGLVFQNKTYELKNIINVEGVDSLIMKQVDGDEDKIYSLNKEDCRFLNINFEPKLQIFPECQDFVLVEEETKINSEMGFDENNLATYPKCHEDNMIRHMVIKLNNFIYKNHELYYLPLMHEPIKSIAIMAKQDLKSNSNLTIFRRGESINYENITRKICGSGIDEDCSIYLELQLYKVVHAYMKNDKVLAVNPQSLEGLNAEQLFNINIII